jgi:hypothetical protein
MRGRVRPSVLEECLEAAISLQVIEGYKPHNTQYSAEQLLTLKRDMEAAQQREIHTQHAADAARDGARAAEWKLYDAILGARSEVMAQFGPDSNEIAQLGLKKRSERKRPTRSARSSTPADSETNKA